MVPTAASQSQLLVYTSMGRRRDMDCAIVSGLVPVEQEWIEEASRDGKWWPECKRQLDFDSSTNRAVSSRRWTGRNRNLSSSTSSSAR
mmetsp:Transcript_11116/g.32207  ORF Transcript_11116/g.32207 Transcript_11116/m.32207 type:complete len:88 (-) Transcript_11116:119-382(-)